MPSKPWTSLTLSFTNPACCNVFNNQLPGDSIDFWYRCTFLECLFIRLSGSLENCAPPPLRLLTRYELLVPTTNSSASTAVNTKEYTCVIFPISGLRTHSLAEVRPSLGLCSSTGNDQGPREILVCVLGHVPVLGCW